MWRLYIILLFLISILSGQQRITILFSNNINGELQNCLCKDQPNGALEKLTYQAHKIKKDNDQTLLFDAGDFYTPFGDVQKNALMRKAQDIIKYDAIAIGDQAFASGVRFFNSAIFPKLDNITTVNLKLFNKSLGEPKIFKFKNGLKVVVIGIIGEEVFKFYDETKIRGLSIDAPVTSLEKHIKKLKSEVDFIIVLSHQGLQEDHKLAKQVSGIDLIIGGHSQNEVLKPQKTGSTYIVQAGSGAHYLGRVYLDFSDDKILSNIEGDPIALSLDLPNNQEIVQLAIKDNFKNFQIYMKAKDIKAGVPPGYLISSASECASCHQKQFQNWQKSNHAHSFNIIKKEEKTNLLKCITFHVSGFGRKDGFINENLTPGLAMITCTECHLTSARHLANSNGGEVVKIKEDICTRCHNLKNDPDFKFEESIKRIKH